LKQTKNISLAKLHISVLLFGAAGLFAKFTAIPAMILVSGRVFFAAIGLFLFLKISKQNIGFQNKKDVLSFIGLGILLAFHWFSFFYSIKLSNVAIGLITYSTFPVFVLFFEPLFLKTKFQLKDILFVLLAFIGILILSNKKNIQADEIQGIIWGISSGLSFALLAVFNKSLVNRYSGIKISFYQDFFAAFVLLPFLILNVSATSTTDWLWLLLLGIVFTALAHTFFIQSLKKVNAIYASIVATLEPVYGVVLAIIIIDEIPALNEILGGLFVLSAVLLKTFLNKRKNV
jgi:drug/metabolite transporter (DMT)-like permease